MKYQKYAYSIKTQRVRERDFPYNGEKINNTESLYSFLKSLQTADNERLVVIFLDNQNQVIGLQVREGTVNSVLGWPRDIVRSALLFNASALVLAHNHPSGATQPSTEDIEFTKKVMEAASVLDINVHDHMIVAADTGRFLSMREEMILNFN